MEASKGSRLPKPSASGSRVPQIRIPPRVLSENRVPPQIEPVNTKLASLRRSKSVADLRPRNYRAVPPVPKTNRVPISRPVAPLAAAKTTQKRKAEKASVEEVKAKVMKPPKIPDWDYKARYNQLREKHSVLHNEHKKQSSRVAEFGDLETKYNDVMQKHQELKQNFSTVTNLNSALTEENKILQNNKTELETMFQQLQSSTKQQLASLTEQHEVLLKKYEELVVVEKEKSDKLYTLNMMFDDLKKINSELKEKHDKLVEAHCDLQEDFAKYKSAFVDLEMQTRTNKNLSEQIVRLQEDLLKGEILRRKLHNTIQDLKGNIRVFCRVRPPINTEEEQSMQCLINYMDEKTIEIRKSRDSINAISGKPCEIKAEFTLDRVFEPNSTQMEIFEDLSQLVQSALDGYDICVFAYGQTGSGKTYTMQGVDDPDQIGLIPRTVDLIFNSIDKLSRAGWAYEVKASFLEIYNENVRDLLNLNYAQNLEIRCNEGKGTTVTNLHIQPMNSAEELKTWMTEAQRNRATAATDFNEHSSRSHAVTKIYLYGVNEGANMRYTGSINLVDLAGSESAKTTANERLQETKSINKSLSTLGSVMLALYNKEKHIPYRNSKLTYLLQSSLGGNSKTLMVVNVSPFEECFSESVNSLRFASKVKEVKMCVKRNKTNFH